MVLDFSLHSPESVVVPFDASSPTVSETEKRSAERVVRERERQEKLNRFNIDFAKTMEEAAKMRERLESMDKKYDLFLLK